MFDVPSCILLDTFTKQRRTYDKQILNFQYWCWVVSLTTTGTLNRDSLKSVPCEDCLHIFNKTYNHNPSTSIIYHHPLLSTSCNIKTSSLPLLLEAYNPSRLPESPRLQLHPPEYEQPPFCPLKSSANGNFTRLKMWHVYPKHGEIHH